MSKIIHTVTLPGALVDHVLESTDAELKSIINAGKSAGRGAVRVSATRDDLEEFLTACWTLEGGPGMEASKRERAAFLRFAKALSELPQDAPAVPVEVPPAGVAEASPVDVWESEGGFSPDVYGDRRAYSQPEAETAEPDARERSTVAAGVVRDAGVEASELASELERLADRAEGLAAEAQEWSAVVDGALAVAEAVRALDVVEGLSGTVGWEAVGKRESERTGEDVRAASGLVKDAGSLLRKIIGLRKTMGNASAACSGDAEMEGVCDHWHGVVVNAESDAREALGRVEAAAGTVTDAVDSIQDVIDHVCRKCGCLVTPGTDGNGKLTRDMGSCGCRAVMAARLDALGGFQPDVETVRAGRLLDADREELVEAGQLALSGCWDEAAELILEAVRYDGTGEAVAHVVAGEPTVALPGAEAAVVAERAESASIERERAETAAALEGYRAAGDAVRASFDVRWAVQLPPVEGVPVRVTRGGKAPVDITWSGVGRQCWSHCPDECPGMEIAEWCTCEPYPVITVDGPGEPYSWEDCARCAASTLGVSADVMADAAVRSATGVRDTVDPARVADELDAVAAENAATAAFWEDGVRGQEERSAQSGVQSVQEWCASEAAAMGGYAEPYRARAVECAVWAGVFRSEATSDRVYPRRVVPVPVVALPDVVSDPSGVDVWESEGGAAGGTSGVVICHGKRGGVFPVAFRGPYAGTVRVPRSVALAGARGRLVGARVRLEAAVEYSQTCSAWAKDAADLHAEAKRSAGVLGDAVWVDSETSGRWYYRARNVETASFKRRWDAECAVRACEREIAAIEAEAVEVAERSRSGRRFLERAMSGEVPAGRGGWVSADGGTAVMFPLVNDVDVNPDERYGEDNEQARAFVDLLGDAVAARDEGRTLTAKDFPTVATHGKRGAASGAHKRAVAQTVQPLFKPWTAPKIPKAGKAPDARALQAWDEDWSAGEGVLAETEAAPGVWLPMAAVTLADVAAGNGWTVAMHRDGGRVVVRAAATLKDRAGMPAGRAGEVVAVWEGGVFDQDRSGANIAGRWLAGATLKQAFGTVANAATRPGVLAPLVLVGGSAPAPGGVSDPGGVDVWENEGGAVETPEAETPEEAWEPSAHTVLVRPMDDTDAGPRVDVYGYVGVCSCGERTWYPQKRDTARVMGAHRDGVVRVLGGYRGGSVSGGAPEPDDYTELLPPAKSDDPKPRAPGQDPAPEAEAEPVMVGGVCSCGAGIERPLNGPRPACTHEGTVGSDGSTVVGGQRVKAAGHGRCMNDHHDVDGVALYVAGNYVPQCGPCVADRIGVAVSALPAPEPVASAAPVVYGSAGWLTDRLDTITDRAQLAVWDSGVSADLDRYADRPAVLACRNAEWQAEQAHALYQDAESERVLFEARELTGACAAALDDDDQADAEDRARRARGLVAVMVLCALEDAEGWTYSPERFEALPEGARILLTEYAAPYPARWLFPRPTPASERLLIPFHGPGGWAYGIRHVLRAADVDMVGIDNEPGAVETARAAGFECVLGSVTDLDPEHPALRYVTGKVPSPPCQGFSIAGLGAGRSEAAVQVIADAIRAVPQVLGWDPEGATTPQGIEWEKLREDLAELPDPRPGLMLEVAVWAAAMRAEGGELRWIAMEQSDRLPGPILDALRETLTLLGFRTIETETLDATVHGAASHRKRLFLLAFLGEHSPAVPLYPARPMPTTSFAKLTGWNESATVHTRGKRGINPATGKPKGGGSFPASTVSTCITATAYGWTNSETGQRFDPADIGRAVGFPGGFPWQHVGRGEGIRNKTQRKADVVFTGTAAAVIGRAIGRPWEPQTREFIETLYGHEPETETVTAELVEPLAIEGATAPRRLGIEGAAVRLALEAAPVPTGRTFWEPGERVTLNQRPGRVRQSDIRYGVRVQWDDAPDLDATWEDQSALWAEGTEPAARRPIAPPYRPAPRTIAPPYTPPAPVPVRALIPAPRTEPVPVASAPAAAAGLLDAFGALDRELDAARALWERARV